MILLAWNCQGLAKPKAIRALRSLLSNSRPDVLFLLKIKTSDPSTLLFVLTYFSLSQSVIIPPIGIAGGICLAWKNFINASVTAQNSFLINIHISAHLCPTW